MEVVLILTNRWEKSYCFSLVLFLQEIGSYINLVLSLTSHFDFFLVVLEWHLRLLIASGNQNLNSNGMITKIFIKISHSLTSRIILHFFRALNSFRKSNQHALRHSSYLLNTHLQKFQNSSPKILYTSLPLQKRNFSNSNTSSSENINEEPPQGIFHSRNFKKRSSSSKEKISQSIWTLASICNSWRILLVYTTKCRRSW